MATNPDTLMFNVEMSQTEMTVVADFIEDNLDEVQFQDDKEILGGFFARLRLNGA